MNKDQLSALRPKEFAKSIACVTKSSRRDVCDQLRTAAFDAAYESWRYRSYSLQFLLLGIIGEPLSFLLQWIDDFCMTRMDAIVWPHRWAPNQNVAYDPLLQNVFTLPFSHKNQRSGWISISYEPRTSRHELLNASKSQHGESEKIRVFHAGAWENFGDEAEFTEICWAPKSIHFTYKAPTEDVEWTIARRELLYDRNRLSGGPWSTPI